MKILSIGNFNHPSWDGSVCDEEHIAQALEELGHEVVRIQREDTLQFIPHTFEAYDFVLISQWDGYPDTLETDKGSIPFIDALKYNLSISWDKGHPPQHKDTKIVYWAFDYQADGQEWHEKLVKGADLYLSKRIADSKYPNWRWLSQDFAPDFLFEVPGKVEKDIDVLFTGSYLDWATERNETVKAVGENFNLVIHSVNQWPQGNEGPLMDNQLPELYSRAKIVLSIDHTLEAGYWSDRNAQALCCGAFVLFRYIPLSEARFGSNVAYFYSVDDCLEKIQYYLKNEDKRRAIAGNGYYYAQRYLKVKNRVNDLLTIVGSL